MQINLVPEDTVRLNFTSDDPWYDDSKGYVFVAKLPELRHLKIDGMRFKEIQVDSETTPDLRTLRVVNLGDDRDFNVTAPKLKDVTIHYFKPPGGRADQIKEMLRCATKLEEFDLYELWIEDDLKVASNALKSVYIHRSDAVQGLQFWAPNLESLKLQANFRIERLTFLTNHYLKESLPEDHVTPMNIDLPQSAVDDNEKHPNAVLKITGGNHGRNFGAGVVAAHHNMMSQVMKNAQNHGSQFEALKAAVEKISRKQLEDPYFGSVPRVVEEHRVLDLRRGAPGMTRTKPGTCTTALWGH